MKTSILLALPIVASLASPLFAAGTKNVPFYAWTKKAVDGAWQLQVDGTYPGNWSCKGTMVGRGDNWTRLPAQTVALACVNGPANGRASFIPTGTGFAEFKFRLNNGYQGQSMFK